MVQERDIAVFENSIVENLVFRFKMNKTNANEAVKHSVLQPLFHKYPDIVMHYPIENWSDDIWKEYNHIPVTD